MRGLAESSFAAELSAISDQRARLGFQDRKITVALTGGARDADLIDSDLFVGISVSILH